MRRRSSSGIITSISPTCRKPSTASPSSILSDLHVEMSETAMERVVELSRGVDYDLCVLTGDYRGADLRSLRADAGRDRRRCARGAQGPDLRRARQSRHDLHGAGIRGHGHQGAAQRERDDRARRRDASISPASTTRISTAWTISRRPAPTSRTRSSPILISHTPEIYRQAAHADFNLLLSGHTHGGQICLPGGIPDHARLRLAALHGIGALAVSRHDRLHLGRRRASRIVPVRFNCPPEITLHHLHRADVRRWLHMAGHAMRLNRWRQDGRDEKQITTRMSNAESGKGTRGSGIQRRRNRRARAPCCSAPAPR